MTPIQLTFDANNPDTLARFWMVALRYVEQPPPEGHPTWADYWRSVGVPEEELGGDGIDSIVDPDGVGPRVWFQQVPEGKTAKNRLHLDLRASSGRSVSRDVRQQQVDAEVARLTAIGATIVRRLDDPGIDHYAVVLHDPEGNEFCVN